MLLKEGAAQGQLCIPSSDLGRSSDPRSGARPPQPSPAPPASCGGCSTKDGLLRWQEINLWQGWLDYRAAEWVGRSLSTVQLRAKQAASVAKENGKRRHRANKTGRVSRLTLKK